MTATFEIAGRPIGPSHPPYVIAELSGNHNGSLERALELVRIAKRAGADAVKLQTYTADTMTIDAPGPEFEIRGGPWSGRRLHELYREAATPWDWHPRLFEEGKRLGLTVFSTPFDSTAVEFLLTLGAPAMKIASFEATDLPLLAKIAGAGKPVILSTGMADLVEISQAVDACRAAGSGELTLLHCVSGYPSSPAEANLRTIPHMAQTFDCPIGLSDHTLGVATSVAAVAMGACVIEKHFTLARADGGPDAGFSLEPDELAELCKSVREAWQALGRIDYGRKQSERGNAIFRRSLYIVRDVAAGEKLTAENVRSIRPGFGLAPKHLPTVLGRTARAPLARGTALKWEHLE